MKQTSRAWIFVSHSKQDLAKVRQVRDALEKAGAEPILFFLKCLSDHDEVDGLIKREIDARYFFLLCDSANAKKSKWVQDEVAHVKSLHGRRIELIDLDSDWAVQLTGITNLVSNATAYFSYSVVDRVAVDSVRSALMERDFATWDARHDLLGGEHWGDEIRSAIEAAARFGYFLHFMSRFSLLSTWVSHEMERALDLGIGSRYIPVMLDPPAALGDLLPAFARERLWIDYSHRNVDQMLPSLLRALEVNDTESSGRD